MMKSIRLVVKSYCRDTSYSLKHRYSTKSVWKQPPGQDTGISIHNCILNQKVPLILKDNIGTWYSCGPTVYDSAHIGHASCYVKLDIIQRILINYFNVNLITSMGITDIDDKIINRSKAKKISWKTLTQTYEAEFWKDMSDLNILPPDFILRVSDNMSAITSFIKGIEDKNMCYTTSDKSVYFNTEVYGKYGKFQNAQTTESDIESSEKISPSDFALWKAHKEGEPYWESDWGNGRPGWHIECSAMVSKLYGKTVDFHAGGIDLQFPHHENEEAQSCAHHNKDQWVNYWLHTGHLHQRKDVKMSKSLNNTVSINELLNAHSSETFRMACLMSHYRYPMEYNEEFMANAKTILEKIKFFIRDCTEYANNPPKICIDDEDKLMRILQDAKSSIDISLRDDFDTSKCINEIIKLLKETNKIIKNEQIQSTAVLKLNPVVISLMIKYIKKVFNDFGICFDKNKGENVTGFSEIVDSAVQFRHSVRTRALETKDKTLLKDCDNLRTVLMKNKIHINDKSTSRSMWILKE